MGTHVTTFQFDEELFMAFKTKCTKDGVSMKERFEKYMRDVTKEPQTKKEQPIEKPNLEIFTYIDNRLEAMTAEEMKLTSQKLQDLWNSDIDYATKKQIESYAIKIKQRYASISA